MKYESEVSKIIHQSAKDKYKAGLISEARMREFDEMCLKNQKIKKTSSVYSDGNSVSIKNINPATA